METNDPARLPLYRDHIPSLDGVRGVAILLVLVRHFGLLGSDATASARLVNHISRVGWVGVDLFFVLSGFLITRILWDAKGSRRFFATFYARRALRIFPLYYAVLIFAYFVVPLVHREPIPVRGAWWVWLYLSNIRGAMIGEILRGTPHINLGHFWSLAVEEQFYFVWPLAVFLLDRRGLLLTCAIAIISAFALRNGLLLAGFTYAAPYLLTPCRMDGLAIGSAIALMTRTTEGIELCRRLARPLFVICGMGLLVLFAVRPEFEVFSDRSVQFVGMSLTPLFFGAMIFLTIGMPAGNFLERTFDRGWLRFFGRHAYGLYVIHQLLLGVSIRAGRPFAAWPLLQVIVITLGGTAASVAFAFVSLRFFEGPINRLKRFFPYARGNSQQSAKAPLLLVVPQS